MGYADPPALRDMNAVIDLAATAADRGPQAIRRLYNVFGRFGSGAGFLQGSPRNWTEQLAALALDDGMSTFILGTDDPADVRRFADEVAPATRELVQRERARVAGSGIAASGSTAPGEPAWAAAPDWMNGGVPLAVTPTPDDGTRLTEDLPWDESSRPVVDKPSDTAYTPQQQASPNT